MVGFGDIRTWKPDSGQVTTWRASAGSRSLMRKAARDSLEPTHQQAEHLWNAHRLAAQGLPMPRLIISAWRFAGTCDLAAMTATINAHVECQDTYHSAFEIQADHIVRRTIGEPARLEFVARAEGYLDTEQIYAHVLGSTPGTLEWDCFTFGVIQNAGYFTFYAAIDHLHFDGMSVTALFSDIHNGYQARVWALPDPVAHGSDYRGHSRRQQEQSAALTLESPEVQAWIGFADDGPWPAFPLPVGVVPEAGPGIFITETLLDAAQTDAFAFECRAAGARFSGGVMACAALADHRFIGRGTFRGLTPADTRSGARGAHSIGWFASLFPVSVPIGDGDFSTVARAAQASFDGNRHLAAAPLRRAVELAATAGHKISVSGGPSMMVSFMDLRDDVMAALLEGDGPEGDGPGVFADPLSGGGVNVWINRYRTGTTVTLSLPDTAAARTSAHRYITALRSAFAAAAAGAPANTVALEGR